MPRQRLHSPLDALIQQVDTGLRTLIPGASHAQRSTPSPSSSSSDSSSPNALTLEQKRHAAALMRVNHTGEVCAQALYQGQALTAKLPEVRESMNEAAQEEIDHLAWCEERIKELGSHTSRLNPAFYAMSFGIGALAGKISDKVSLGFVAATEDQVCQHLEEHLDSLPKDDEKSRAIVSQMLQDEAQHAQHALDAGGYAFPKPVKALMTGMSKVMTHTTYRV